MPSAIGTTYIETAVVSRAGAYVHVLQPTSGEDENGCTKYLQLVLTHSLALYLYAAALGKMYVHTVGPQVLGFYSMHAATAIAPPLQLVRSSISSKPEPQMHLNEPG